MDTKLFNQLGTAIALAAQRTEITDQEALKVKNLQRVWVAGESMNVGDRRQYQDKLYKCRQAHTTQADWTPDAYQAGWEVIDEVHAGTQEDPIPYSQGMALEKDKYYTQGDVLYLCIRDTGQPIYNDLADVVDNYVKTV